MTCDPSPVSEQGGAWLLKRGDEVLGEVHLTPDGDFPWLVGRFTARPGFAAVKELFDALRDRADEQRRAWATRTIEETMTFVAPDGPVAEFWLHIDGDRAWFRYSDEPLEED
ncbi:hypothetical protein EV186_1021411 [Labedaea rhizosphaerae]|uniref:Uncharacterized protein n=1 Tax=Labedaea rhizosphaerae TaxID=598644 RepID=A0A4R6SHM8_LABRH|nr:hypothetical protein EV186_1021411 [Labedaea rhizosphaerae]